MEMITILKLNFKFNHIINITGDWVKLEEVSTLLEPFTVQTDILQSDAQSLSSIIPCILNLECRLQQHTAAKAITTRMLQDLHSRFATLLYPDTDNLYPIPAAACLLDPTMAQAIMSLECAVLLRAPKVYVSTVCERKEPTVVHIPDSEDASTSSSLSPLTSPTSLQRFKFLANKIIYSRVTIDIVDAKGTPYTRSLTTIYIYS